MTIRARHRHAVDATRMPTVAGSFYPSDRATLASLVEALLAEAGRSGHREDGGAPALDGPPVGLLVPHAGLVYSGVVAAAGWRLLGSVASDVPLTVVLLGTNHGAAWLDGVAAWEAGEWRTPLGDLDVDGELARAVVDLGSPFVVDRGAHLDEHSIEVQLPFVATVHPSARIVPLSVAAGTGSDALRAGERLGRLLATRRSADSQVVVVISTDMAHYPARHDGARATAELLTPILELDAAAVASLEATLASAGIPGLVCGMCGIQPTVLGLATLRSMGALRGVRLADATSADAGGSSGRTVGYLSAAFTA
jgi:hypothetical protein